MKHDMWFPTKERKFYMTNFRNHDVIIEFYSFAWDFPKSGSEKVDKSNLTYNDSAATKVRYQNDFETF